MLEYHSEWLEHHGKKVQIDGEEYTINVSTYKAIYPFEHMVIDVYAERGNNGYDLIETVSDEVFESVDRQLGGVYK